MLPQRGDWQLQMQRLQAFCCPLGSRAGLPLPRLRLLLMDVMMLPEPHQLALPLPPQGPKRG